MMIEIPHPDTGTSCNSGRVRPVSQVLQLSASLAVPSKLAEVVLLMKSHSRFA